MSRLLLDTLQPFVARIELTGIISLGEERRLLECPELVHTNHFLHPEFAVHDEINIFAKNSSKRRLEAVQTTGIPDADDIEGHHRLLSGGPINVADNGDIRRERTVAAVILHPDTGELRLWPGNPAIAKEHLWNLR